MSPSPLGWAMRRLRRLPLFALAAAACASPQPTPSMSGEQVQRPPPVSATGEPTREQATGSTRPSRGPRPPDFELDTLDGDSFRLSDHLGTSVVLLDFWATYCDPCLAAMPHLDELYREHKERGLLVVGVSIDGPESVAQVRSTVQQLGVEFPIVLDEDSAVVAKYNPKVSAPFSVLIGRDGAVITKAEGYTTGGAAALDADIQRALAEAL